MKDKVSQSFRALKYYDPIIQDWALVEMFIISCAGLGNAGSHQPTAPGMYASDVRGTRDARKAHAPPDRQGDGMRL